MNHEKVGEICNFEVHPTHCHLRKSFFIGVETHLSKILPFELFSGQWICYHKYGMVIFYGYKVDVYIPNGSINQLRLVSNGCY